MSYTDSAADRRAYALGNIAQIGSGLEHLTLEIVAGFVSEDKRKRLIPLVGTSWARLLQLLGNYAEVCELDESLRRDLLAWKNRANDVRIRRNRVIHDVVLSDDMDPQAMGYRVNATGTAVAGPEEGDLTDLWEEILQVTLALEPLTRKLNESPEWHGMPGSIFGSRQETRVDL